LSLSEDVKARVSIGQYLAGIGVEVKGDGKKAMACCPFHADKNPSMSIDAEKGVWKCFACNIGGTVLDMHMRKSGLPFKDALFDLAQKNGIAIDEKPHKTETYEYRDAYGRPVMKIDRIEAGSKKKFRQYHTDETGAEKNGLDGVTRVLYRLDKWQGIDHVAICEGEKCVHALESLDMHATTNPGGSGGWLDAYAESLAGKHVEIWPDNDEPGEKWLDRVAESLAGKVAALKIMRVPKPYNDVADMVEAKGKEFALDIVFAMHESEQWIDRGIRIDLLSSREAYDLYRKRVLESETAGIDLGRWLPSMRSNTRPLMPGDLFSVLADTGVGKTAILANIAYSQRPLPVIFFELELSPEAMAERFIARDTQTETLDVEKEVRNGIRHSVDGWAHVYTCPNTRIDVDYMEALVMRSELKIGRKPALVLVDYIGLIGGGGSGGKRYERLSNIAEDLKRMARSTGTVVGMASQVRRDGDRVEIGLHDAKETGSIENSSQLVMGAWRTSAADMTIKILKQTKRAGQPEIACHYDGNRQTIKEAYRGNAVE